MAKKTIKHPKKSVKHAPIVHKKKAVAKSKAHKSKKIRHTIARYYVVAVIIIILIILGLILFF